jgi:hypothetical protein
VGQICPWPTSPGLCDPRPHRPNALAGQVPRGWPRMMARSRWQVSHACWATLLWRCFVGTSACGQGGDSTELAGWLGNGAPGRQHEGNAACTGDKMGGLPMSQLVGWTLMHGRHAAPEATRRWLPAGRRWLVGTGMQQTSSSVG